jgi:transposase
MPWMECDPMSLRLKFVSRLLEGEKMTDLCQEFGISRKTGYKLLERYKTEGVTALQTRTSRPHRSPNRTPEAVVKLIVETRHIHPSWGAPKILIRHAQSSRVHAYARGRVRRDHKYRILPFH